MAPSAAKNRSRLLVALGQEVRAARTAKGLSQEDVPGFHRNYVGGVERAEINPTVTQLSKLAEALGTTGWELLMRAAEQADGS